MARFSWIKVSALALALFACDGVKSARAQDWGDYLHWPYVPPQVPGNGFEYNGLYDGWYRYPREQRIVPQIQGPYYRNEYAAASDLSGSFAIPPDGTSGTRRSSTRATTPSWTCSEIPGPDWRAAQRPPPGTSADHEIGYTQPGPRSSSPSEGSRGLVVLPDLAGYDRPRSTAIWK